MYILYLSEAPLIPAIAPFFLASVMLILVFVSDAKAVEFQDKLQLELRHDKRSDRDARQQYRLRYYPELNYSDSWSAKAFVATGDNFSASHNTIDSDSADNIYLRHLYLQYQNEQIRTEIGVLPIYKGRVSSSGLDKDGWVKGARLVLSNVNNGLLEFVAGELNDLSAASALNTPDQLNYFEMEYTSKLDAQNSYEFSLERVLETNYVRSEFRHKAADSLCVYLEHVQQFDLSNHKTLIGIEGHSATFSHFKFNLHYSYTSPEIGMRVRLSEHFIGTGHSLRANFSYSEIFDSPLKLFSRIDLLEGQSRWMLGLSLSI